MAEVWRVVQSLEGRTLHTQRGAAFKVEHVTDNAALIEILASHTRRGVPRGDVERGYALGLRGEELTPARIRAEGASEFHPAYVVAILRAVSGT